MVTTLNDKMFRNHLEDCMRYGKPMLIENIEEELDPLLIPVLEKRCRARRASSMMIVLSDKEVDLTSPSPSSTTRLPNPHYSPELSAKTLVIDFTVTMVGLEDQLLGKLILKEKHELEEQRQALVESDVVQEEDQAARGRSALPIGQLDRKPAGRRGAHRRAEQH